MYTTSDIAKGWYKEPNNNFFSNIVIARENAGYNMSYIFANVKNFIDEYKIKNTDLSLNEDIWDKLLAKTNKKKKTHQNSIEPSEYVATNVGYHYKSEESFYNFTEIEIEIAPNIVKKGIIRISSHEVDLNEWAKANNKYDFGISFVIKDINNNCSGNTIVDDENRYIVICEYTYNKNVATFDFLNTLVDEIINIKKHKKYIHGTPILGTSDKLVANNLTEKIINAIKKGLLKIL